MNRSSTPCFWQRDFGVEVSFPPFDSLKSFWTRHIEDYQCCHSLLVVQLMRHKPKRKPFVSVFSLSLPPHSRDWMAPNKSVSSSMREICNTACGRELATPLHPSLSLSPLYTMDQSIVSICFPLFRLLFKDEALFPCGKAGGGRILSLLQLGTRTSLIEIPGNTIHLVQQEKRGRTERGMRKEGRDLRGTYWPSLVQQYPTTAA